MSGVEILEFVKGEKSARVFAFMRDTGATMNVVCRSKPKEKPESIARRFWARAEDYCDEGGGSASFVVGAYDSEGKVLDTLPVVVDGNGLETMAPLQPPPMTADFALRYSLKCVEARDLSNRKLEAELHKELRLTIAAQRRRIERLEDANDELIVKRLQVVEAIETLKTQAHTRKLNQIEAKADADAKNWVFGQLIEHMPIVLGALTGATKLSKFAEGFDEPTKKMLRKALPDDKRAQFDELIAIGGKADHARKRLEVAGANAVKESTA